MTKPSDDSSRRINLPNGDGQNFIREKRVWIELQQNKLIFRDRARTGGGGYRSEGGGREEAGQGGRSPRSIQVFRMRNSRVAVHRHFHFRVKLENTRRAYAFTHNARSVRRDGERDDRPLVIPYRRFGEPRGRTDVTHAHTHTTAADFAD